MACSICLMDELDGEHGRIPVEWCAFLDTVGRLLASHTDRSLLGENTDHAYAP